MAASPPPPPHVLVFPFPAHGHVNGAMDISRKLGSLGISVTFVCTESYIESMIGQGFHGRDGLPIRLIGLPDGLPPEKSMADAIDRVPVLIGATESMGPSLEALLIKLAEEHPVTCVLYDFILWWIGRLGRRLGIPAYIFYAMSASFFSYLIHIPGFVSQGRLPLGSHTDLRDESNVFKIPGFPPLHAREVPDISWNPNPLSSFSFTVRSTKTWRDARGIIFNTVYELEKEVIEDLKQQAPEMDIRAVGPILPLSFLRGEREAQYTQGRRTEADQEARCLTWLDKQPPSSVLYIAFGTIACLSKAQLHELAMGVEASKQSFLWVVRVPESYRVAPSDQEILGKELNDKMMPYCETDYLPKGFEERTEGKGMILWELAPQREVLAHKAVGGFLTHSGWNSTMESLCKGVPMLCFPILGDQGMNGKLVEGKLQSGKVLRKGEDGMVSREEVEASIKELMVELDHSQQEAEAEKGGVLWRRRAAQVQDLASKAAFPGGSSHSDLQGFVQALARMNAARSASD